MRSRLIIFLVCAAVSAASGLAPSRASAEPIYNGHHGWGHGYGFGHSAWGHGVYGYGHGHAFFDDHNYLHGHADFDHHYHDHWHAPIDHMHCHRAIVHTWHGHHVRWACL